MTDDVEPAPHRLLIISYWYPPAVGAAAERIHSFARYLPDHGWRTHVLTALRPGTPQGDRSPCSGVTDRLASSGQGFAEYDPRKKPSRIRAALRELVFPDRFVAWGRAAVERGLAIVREQKPELLLASFPPASAVQVGLTLHERTGVPLVLDFRDRWIGPGGYEPLLRRTRRAHEAFERRAVAAASGIVTVSDAMADAIAAEQGFPRGRIAVIPNGYEPWSDAKPPASPTASPITISHVGTVIPRNRPDLFFQSVAAIKSSGALGGVRFKFVGNLSRAYLRENGLGDIVETTGLVSREEARRQMRAADALLLLTGAYVGRWGYNAKLFEYLQAGPAILCLEEQSGSNDRKLLQRLAGDRSFFAGVDNPESIAKAVAELRQWRGASNRSVAVPAGELLEYRRDRLAARLANALATIDPTTNRGLAHS